MSTIAKWALGIVLVLFVIGLFVGAAAAATARSVGSSLVTGLDERLSGGVPTS